MNNQNTLFEDNSRQGAWSARVEDSSETPIQSMGATQSVGFHPYATLQLRKPNHLYSTLPYRQSLGKTFVSPFTRIKRVQKMIMAQKLEAKDLNQTGQHLPLTNNQLKPQFKIKSMKTSNKKYPRLNGVESDEEQSKVHIRMIRLEDCPFNLSSIEKQQAKISNGGFSNFSQTFKNRCRIQKRSPRKHQEVSLLGRLNKITDETPLQRYKSKAFGSAQKVAPFIPL